MSRLLLISLGQLNGHILEAVARSGRFAEILVAGRDPARGLRKTNQARIGAALEGHYPTINFVELDVNKASAAATLRKIAPDVALAAPTERLRSSFLGGVKHMPIRYRLRGADAA